MYVAMADGAGGKLYPDLAFLRRIDLQVLDDQRRSELVANGCFHLFRIPQTKSSHKPLAGHGAGAASWHDLRKLSNKELPVADRPLGVAKKIDLATEFCDNKLSETPNDKASRTSLGRGGASKE